MVVENFAQAQFHSFLSRLWNDGHENYRTAFIISTCITKVNVRLSIVACRQSTIGLKKCLLSQKLEQI